MYGFYIFVYMKSIRLSVCFHKTIDTVQVIIKELFIQKYKNYNVKQTIHSYKKNTKDYVVILLFLGYTVLQM